MKEEADEVVFSGGHGEGQSSSENHSGLVSNLGYRSLSCERFSLEGAHVSGGEKLVCVGNPLEALVAINSLLVWHWEFLDVSSVSTPLGGGSYLGTHYIWDVSLECVSPREIRDPLQVI